MSVIFSKACEYAFQSVIYLATQPSNSPVFQRDISKALNIPPHFLGKILQLLTRHGIVTSQKGKSGGFSLNLLPEQISLVTIAKIVDGEKFLDHCIVGFPGCKDDNPCPLHPQWIIAKKAIIKLLESRHVGELSEELQTKLDYIASIKNNI